MNTSTTEPIEPAPADTVDDDAFEGSDYGESLVSSGFTSLASRVMRHSHEGGRCVAHTLVSVLGTKLSLHSIDDISPSSREYTPCPTTRRNSSGKK